MRATLLNILEKFKKAGKYGVFSYSVVHLKDTSETTTETAETPPRSAGMFSSHIKRSPAV
jgi:hypothetical protein